MPVSVPPPSSSSVPSSADGAAPGAPQFSAEASASTEAAAPGTAEPCQALVPVGRVTKCPPPSDEVLRQQKAIVEARKKAAAEALIAKAKEEPKSKQKARPTTNPPAPNRPIPKPPPPDGGAAAGAPVPNTEPPTLETASPPPKPRPESNLAQPAREERPRPRNDSVNRGEAYRRAREWTHQRRAEQHHGLRGGKLHLFKSRHVFGSRREKVPIEKVGNLGVHTQLDSTFLKSPRTAPTVLPRAHLIVASTLQSTQATRV